MAIEFRCVKCNKLLRTGDDTAGKQAQCPECGAITPIPMTSAEMAADIVPAAASPSYDAGAPLGDSRAAVDPYAAAQPYGVPPPSENVRAYAASRVSAPATALIVTSVIGMFWQVLVGLVQLGRVGAGAADPRLKELPAEFLVPVVVFAVLLGLALCAVTLIGAVKMKNLTSHTFAVVAAIFALIPCTSPCCFLGLPFGIWALVVLNDESVKAGFRR